jgi:hypothetical protein
MYDIKTSRRQFLAISATVVAAAAVVPRIAHAQGALPQIDEADPTAAALGYKHDTTKVDAAKYPSHKPTQACANCKLVQGADADAWRPCSIFPGKSVNAKGWCAAYAAKA